MELASEANDYEFSKAVPFRFWIRSCNTLIRQARVYATEKNNEEAYKLYLRMGDLYLNKLPSHPEYSSNRHLYNSLKKTLFNSMEQAERLKKILGARPPAIEEDIEPDHGGILETTEQSPLSESTDISSQIVDSPVLNIEDPELANAVAALQPKKSQSKGISETNDTHIPTNSARTSHMDENNVRKPPVKPASNVQFTARYKLENGTPLRSVFIPKQLRSIFLEKANKNTLSNLETCGILCGKLNRNAFFISHLVIPHQESTPDSCQTLREEELLDYVDSRDLFILGWIHTHPTQTCFMSSIDLHTQAGYQLMLPEAIAIVCAPRSSPNWGAFRLTDPPGVNFIRKCRLPGFHPHSENHLYTTATSPGHVLEIAFNLEVKDLRQNT